MHPIDNRRHRRLYVAVEVFVDLGALQEHSAVQHSSHCTLQTQFPLLQGLKRQLAAAVARSMVY